MHCPPPLMRRPVGNSAGAHFRAQKQQDPPSLPRLLPNSENRFWGWTSLLRSPKAPRKYFTPRRGSLSRGGTRYPDRPEPGDRRYARRNRHDLNHRSRPPVGAPCGALYSGSDTGAPRQRSATARHRRPLIPGVRPARRRAVVRFHRVAERLSTPRTATPSWGENTSRAEFRRRRYYVHPRTPFSAFGSRRANDGGPRSDPATGCR